MTAPARQPARRGYPPCPSCGHTPAKWVEAKDQADELKIDWIFETRPATATKPGAVASRKCCGHCQPDGPMYAISCRGCTAGPFLTGALVDQVRDNQLPAHVADRLKANRWLPARDGNGWVCPDCQIPRSEE
ncbi:hypothetical protein ACIA49_38665 [Kribbella sp. NPDC051587]|uniref:hypothetical protein n=1 Tax=Kribbella sp. NPDC051587 TaxID=3364119 RepID=UPI0037B3E4BF